MLAGFLLGEREMGTKLLPLLAIHILPAELQEIPDAERSIDAKHNERIVTKFSTAAEIFRHVVEFLFVTDRFCCCHNILGSFLDDTSGMRIII